MTSRRSFLQSASLAAATLCSPVLTKAEGQTPLQEFNYADVDLMPGPAQTQFEQTQSVLMGLNEDSLLKPWRLRAGLPAPGPDLGGWYDAVLSICRDILPLNRCGLTLFQPDRHSVHHIQICSILEYLREKKTA